MMTAGKMSGRTATKRQHRSWLFFVLIAIVTGTIPTKGFAAQGVYADEVVVGTHADLSGPLSNWGTSVRNGIEMAFAEANEAGGINGRTVRLIAEDDSYNSSRAASAVRELVETDNVFAVLSPLGTPTTHVAATEALDRNIPYLFPLTAVDQPLELRSPMLFTLSQPAEGEIAQGIDRITEIRPGAEIAILASDDALGTALRRGVKSRLGDLDRSLVADVTYAHGATDFSVPLGWLRERDAGVIVLGAVGDEVITIIQAARAMRWQPTFLCASSCYTPELAALGGNIIDGLYSVGQVPIPYPDDRLLGEWARNYENRFDSVATKQALTAYRNAKLFLTVLERVGRTPTQANFRHALETLGPWTDAVIGMSPILFTEEEHQGQLDSFFVQAKKGRWEIVPMVSPTRL
jgi:branched-chain amino acid transport system substrate-binding protein